MTGDAAGQGGGPRAGGGAATDEPDDELLDRLDAGLPPRSDEEARARAPFERLRARVRDLPLAEPDPGWEDRARDRWQFAVAARRRRTIKIVAVAVVGLAAVVALMITSTRRGHRPDTDIAAVGTGPGAAVPDVRIVRDGSDRSGPATVGSTLELHAAQTSPHVELRVYRDGRLVARCPGETPCAPRGADLELAVPLTEPGNYRPVVISGAAAVPPPDAAGLDVDMLIARRAGLTFTLGDPILVAP